MIAHPKTPPSSENFIGSVRRTLETGANGFAALLNSLDGQLAAPLNDSISMMLGIKGRVIVTGMGKSGHVGGKLAATFASTGTPSFFVHPAEASHGDLGMITPKDLVLAISNSGATDEIVTILPLIKRMGAPLISMTGNPASILAQQADVPLDISIKKEAAQSVCQQIRIRKLGQLIQVRKVRDGQQVRCSQTHGFCRSGSSGR